MSVGPMSYHGPRCISGCGRPALAGYPCLRCAELATPPDDPVAVAYRRRRAALIVMDEASEVDMDRVLATGET